MRGFFSFLLFTLIASLPLRAQDNSLWIQVEAQPSLVAAQKRASAYAQRLPDVAGFALGRNWYGIALGPYPDEQARRLLLKYRSERLIPGDSYIVEANALGRQFWPVGQRPTPQATTPPPAQPQEAQPKPEPQASDETPGEARASEAALTREERMALQEALKWSGVYNAGIDGAFGRGTRNAMAKWQEQNGYETTGILTTRQRGVLFAKYNAVFDGLEMASVRDETAGIEMVMPTALFKFDHYEPPFAHFTARNDSPIPGARLLLISQSGDRAALHGLFDIMETLEIVPLDGAREKRRESFTLTGANDRIISHTEATLRGGAIKGFTLIWPTGDEERRSRVLAEMRRSFTALPAVLSPEEGDASAQAPDLLAGLEIRTPAVSRSGFFIDSRGAVLTSADLDKSCRRITLNGSYEAKIVARDLALGVLVLRPLERLAPPTVANFRTEAPRLQSRVAVAGFSYGGTLAAPSLTFGTLEDIKGLDGEPMLRRLALSALPGDIGGPVVDASGSVIGMLVPPQTGNRVLPSTVSFAAAPDALSTVLAQAGITEPSNKSNGNSLGAEQLSDATRKFTVLVNCWD